MESERGMIPAHEWEGLVAWAEKEVKGKRLDLKEIGARLAVTVKVVEQIVIDAGLERCEFCGVWIDEGDGAYEHECGVSR